MKRIAAVILTSILIVTHTGATSLYDGPDGVLETVRGQVSLKRRGWQNYSSVSEGAPVNRGDLLRVGPNSSAVIRCADGSRRPIPIGDNGVPCSAATGARPSFLTVVFNTIFRGISLVGATRGNKPSGVPIVISPRQTKLLRSNPVLRWTAVTAPSPPTYRVSVKSGITELWSEEVTGRTEVVYSGRGSQALRPGESYRLVVSIKGCQPVTPGDCSSDKEEGVDRAFTILKSEEARQVQDAVAAIRALHLKEDLTQLLIAKYYAGEGLLAEAVSMLEALSGTTTLPGAQQSLGDAYLSMGFVRLAEERYRGALRLAENANDIESQAIAHTALGGVFLQIGNSAEALRRFQQAKALYESLGDQASVEDLNHRISDVPRP
ncbi:MAG TPA: tetratricopeptide repeat protein [Pyrinomonadaceae bacterium]|nr:tetratricopeptide repeat protein [Pyrinomonadaceae bacterium]